MGKKSKRLDRSDFIAVAALLFSMVAVFVSIYEARILKEQQEIMLAQEKTSVWPYLDGVLKYQYSDRLQIRFDFKNKGIGPTKIREMKLLFNGSEISQYSTLLDSVRPYFPADADLGISFRLAEGGVLSPGEEITALLIDSKRFPGDTKAARAMNLQFDVCYCSVYDDCWKIDDQNKSMRPVCE